MQSVPQDLSVSSDINHTCSLFCNETRHNAAIVEVSDVRKSDFLTSRQWRQQSLLLQLVVYLLQHIYYIPILYVVLRATQTHPFCPSDGLLPNILFISRFKIIGKITQLALLLSFFGQKQ
jgi:hypothetical protein